MIDNIPRMDGVWFHIVLNFFGFNDEQGIIVYHDGVQVKNTPKRKRIPGQHASDRRIILGRAIDECFECFPSNRKYYMYSSLSIDELLFYNHILTDKEIMQMIQ